MKRCLINLPAYAILTFPSQQELQQARTKIPTKKYMRGRLLDIKRNCDQVNEAPWNRTLVVQGISNILRF